MKTPQNPSSTPPALRVLVVDDHRDSADVLGRMLTRAGYRVATAISYADACRLCDGEGDGDPGRDDDGHMFDLLIADIDLPNGDGLQLLQFLREHMSDRVRGIVLSGYHDPKTIERAKRIGFDEYLIKPVQFKEIESALQRCAAQLDGG
jgi:two-component system CheB/CheR fusion protein